MLIISNLYLEFKQQLHNKWIYFSALLLILLGIFAFNVAFKSINSFETASKDAISQYQAQLKQNGIVEEKNNNVLSEKTNSFLKKLSQVVHPSAGPGYILLVLSVIGSWFLCIISATIVGNEFSTKTVKIKAAHYGWSNSVIAKQMIILLICVFFILIAIIVGEIGGQISWMIVKNSSIIANSPPPILKSNLLIQFFITLLGLLFYSGISALFSMLFKNTLVGAVCGILFPYIEKLINKWYLPGSCYGNLMGHYFNYYEGGFVSTSPLAVGNMPMEVNWIMIVLSCIIVFSIMLLLSKKQAI
jgi:hypothetical protein